MMRATFVLSAGLLVACGSSHDSVGANAFAHCMEASLLSDRSSSVGSTRLVIDDGVLTITGLRAPAQIATFSGAGFGGVPSAESLANVRASSPSLAFVLGGIGDDLDSAKRNLAAFASLRVPVIFVAGGRDEQVVIDDALDSLEDDVQTRVFDASRLNKIVIGASVFVPVAGAPLGRYARTNASCGYSQQDLDKRDDALGRAGSEHRYLLSWAAPTSSSRRGVSSALLDVDGGDPMLARFAARIGAVGGLFAWPAENARLPIAAVGEGVLSRGEANHALRLVVPQINGAGIIRADGSRVAPGFALLELSDAGISFLGP